MPHVLIVQIIASLYAIVLDLLIVLSPYLVSPYCSCHPYCDYIRYTTGSISSVQVLPVQTK